MKVINKVIEVTHDNSQDSKERTIFEKFTEFNEKLFWIAQEKDYSNIINNFDDKTNNKESKNIKEDICSLYN